MVVNEVSPRVHNSGHLTFEGSRTSQFEQHLRAVAGLPLGPTDLIKPAAMVNLLYEPALKALCGHRRGVLDTPEETYVHWYGKTEPLPLRKMGHITALGGDVDDAFRMAESRKQRLLAA